MDLYLSCGTRLRFPTPISDVRESIAQMNAGGARIIVAKSPVGNLVKYIQCADLSSEKDLRALNTIAERTDAMTETEANIFSGALDAESVNGLDDVLRISRSLEQYDLIPEVTSDRELGGWLVENNLLGVSFPEAVRPYLDYVAIGAEYYANHGGAYTLNGYSVCFPAANYEQLGRFYMDRIARAPDIVRGYIDMEQAGHMFENTDPGIFKGKCYVAFPESPPSPIQKENAPLLPDTDWSVKLKLATPSVPEGVWIRLPNYAAIICGYASETELALNALNARKLEECTLLEARCILPEAGNLMEQYDSIAELIRDGNDLWLILDECGQGIEDFMGKFSSAMEYEDCRTLRLALDISQNLSCYEYIPWGRLEALAEKQLYTEGVSEKLIHSGCIDLARYAGDLLEREGYSLNRSETGYIARNNSEFIYEHTSPEQGGMTVQQTV